MSTAPLLDVRNLCVAFGAGPNVADGVDLSLGAGELLCLVGESGSGKSVTALSLMRLLAPAAKVKADALRFESHDLLALPEAGMVALRGNRIAMVFQEPMTSLNPVMRVGDQIIEALVQHRDLSRADAWAQTVAMLRRVQIPAPEERMRVYPHQLSGGMRQRVMIAMALVCRPSLLIADEPTTALDVTIQSQVLGLIDELRTDLGTAVLFITHNLAVVAEIADRVAVMYAGRIVERASKQDLFGDPMHPYTLALFAATPRAGEVGRPLAAIEGQVPAPSMMPIGCRFSPRCPLAVERCRQEYPPLREVSTGHWAACWRAPIEDSVA